MAACPHVEAGSLFGQHNACTLICQSNASLNAAELCHQLAVCVEYRTLRQAHSGAGLGRTALNAAITTGPTQYWTHASTATWTQAPEYDCQRLKLQLQDRLTNKENRAMSDKEVYKEAFEVIMPFCSC